MSSLLGQFACRGCKEPHVRGIDGLVHFYKSNGGDRKTLREFRDMLEQYAAHHPELEVFYGGDETSIVGRPKGRLDRFGASS